MSQYRDSIRLPDSFEYFKCRNSLTQERDRSPNQNMDHVRSVAVFHPWQDQHALRARLDAGGTMFTVARRAESTIMVRYHQDSVTSAFELGSQGRERPFAVIRPIGMNVT